MKLELTVTLNKRCLCGLILYLVLHSIASVPVEDSPNHQSRETVIGGLQAPPTPVATGAHLTGGPV